MENISDLASSVLSRIAHGLKLKPSELDKLRAWKLNLEQTKRDNHDRVRQLKDELRTIANRVLKLDEEFKRERGAVRTIVGKELDLACAELEQKEGRSAILFENIRCQTVALNKVAELEEALHRGVSESQADDLAVELGEAFENLERADVALHEAEGVTYRKTNHGRADVALHLRELRGQPGPR